LGNCLITSDGTLKLTDFGFSANVDNVPKKILGTPNYIAPEIYSSKRVSSAADVWACGVFFVFMFQPAIFLQGKKTTLSLLMKEVVNHIVDIDDIHAVPDLYKPIVLELLAYHRLFRISAKDALIKFKEAEAIDGSVKKADMNVALNTIKKSVKSA